MKINKYIKVRFLLPMLVLVVLSGCEREISDEAVPAKFSTTGDIFTDNFVGMGKDFYLPFLGSRFDAFMVDNNEGFESRASYRVDVPNATDPNGSFAAAILRIDGAGRNLEGFDALTFYAKASQGVILNEVGFGIDFLTNTNQVTVFRTEIGTNWEKYTIPIPDASKLLQERGMFWYGDGTDDTNGLGYTIWFDDIRFENLGTVAQPRPAILNGEDITVESFIGGATSVSGLVETFNLANGQDITLSLTPSYYTFTSSDPSVATVDEQGNVRVVGAGGTTTITATLSGMEAAGSLTIISQGDFTAAPFPTRPSESVISIFSEAYDNRPVDFYNGFYAPFQTTTSNDFAVNGDAILNYENFNFVGIEFNQNVPTINGKLATHFHMDVFVPGSIPGSADLRIAIVDFGGDGSFGGDDDTDLFQDFDLGTEADQWISLDMDISSLNPKTSLGQIVLSGDGPGNPPANFYADNLYFYREDGSITPETVTLPLDFELSNPANYAFLGFEGADSAIETNPDQSGVNTSATVMRTTKTNGAQFFAGTLLDLDNPIDFSQTQKLSMKVWSPKIGIPVRFALERNDGGAAQVFVDVETTVANEWEELIFDFSGVADGSIDYNRMVIFMEFIVDLGGDGSTYYFDDIQLTN
ncbi:MAG: Ig-like domain-containing protein [Bacteroidota bacterium]